MDKLDQILSKYPDNNLPNGFIDRVRLNFRRRYYFRQRALALSAILLMVAGFYAVFPELAAVNQQLSLQPANFSLLPGLNVPAISSQSSVAAIWQAILNLQDTIISTFSLPAWLGLFSVAIGSGIGIGRIFLLTQPLRLFSKPESGNLRGSH